MDKAKIIKLALVAAAAALAAVANSGLLTGEVVELLNIMAGVLGGIALPQPGAEKVSQ